MHAAGPSTWHKIHMKDFCKFQFRMYHLVYNKAYGYNNFICYTVELLPKLENLLIDKFHINSLSWSNDIAREPLLNILTMSVPP